MRVKFYISAKEYTKMEECLFNIAHILDDVEGRRIDIRYNLITRSYCIIVQCGILTIHKVRNVLKDNEILFY